MHSGWVIILPQLILAAGGFFIFCAGALWQRRPSGVLFAVALGAALSAGALSALVSPGAADFAGLVDAGSYARFFSFILSCITVLTLLFAFQYARVRGFSGDEFYALVLFAALGMILVSSAIHWLTFFLGLELLSISLYILIGVRKGDGSSNEAALKYFIMGSVESGFLTFGIAVVYAVSGKMNIAQSLGAQAVGGGQTGLLLGFGLILAGIGFKISLVPFHLWTPDVYQGAPAPVTAFLSTGSKIALFSALLRFALHTGETAWVALGPVLWILAALTMVVGNITALTQTRAKRLLAYSSVAHMGYLLMALLAVKQNGAQAIMFYSAVYALMDLGAFGTIGLLSAEESDLDELEDYKSLGYSHPWKAALLGLCLLSLAGLPPTAGFIGKFVLFQAALEAGFLWLAVIGILSAIVSIYFYIKVIVLLYMHVGETAIAAPGAGLSGDLACGAVFLLILWLGILPSPLLEIITRIAASLAV